MTALLIILMSSVALALRAGVGHAWWSPAASEAAEETRLLDACTRTLLVVLISLLGLLALGVTYGNVLGSDAAVLSPIR